MPTRKPKRIRRRLSSVTIMISVMSLLSLALFAVVFIFNKEEVKVAAPVTKVVADHDSILVPAPTRQIARGETLRDVDFVQIKFPKSRVSGSYIENIQQFQDAVALSPLPQYLPVPTSAVSFSPLNENAVVDGIPPGMRAVTVRVDVESAVEGWARSGNYVDVILIRSSRRGGELDATIIASNVKILSAGRSAVPVTAGTKAPSTPQTITLLTTQEDGLKIKAASSLGKLTFALRGQGDSLPADTTKLTQAGILGGADSGPMKREQFRGVERDADGNVFVLGDESKWVRAVDIAEDQLGLSARWAKNPKQPTATAASVPQPAVRARFKATEVDEGM